MDGPLPAPHGPSGAEPPAGSPPPGDPRRAEADSPELRAYYRAKQVAAQHVRSLREVLHRRGSEPAEGACRDLLVKLAEDRFTLAVVGQFKRGKSSLMNAVIGREVLPTGVLPLTSAVTILRYGSRERLLITYEGSSLPHEAPVARLADYVTERGNPGNGRRVRAVYVEMPHPFLRRGLEFADTPGVGSAIEANTQTTYDFLPEVDAVLFVTSVDAPLTAAEGDFLGRIQQYAQKVFFVLNKTDVLDRAERQEVLGFVERTLRERTGGQPVRCFPVSARLALSARGERGGPGFAASGLGALEDALAEFLTRQRGAAFLAAVADRAQRLAAAEEQGVQIGLRARSASRADSEQRLAVLRGQLAAARQERAADVRALRDLVAGRAHELALEHLAGFVREEQRLLAAEAARGLAARNGAAWVAAAAVGEEVGKRLQAEARAWLPACLAALGAALEPLAAERLGRVRARTAALADAAADLFGVEVGEGSGRGAREGARQGRGEGSGGTGDGREAGEGSGQRGGTADGREAGVGSGREAGVGSGREAGEGPGSGGGTGDGREVGEGSGREVGEGPGPGGGTADGREAGWGDAGAGGAARCPSGARAGEAGPDARGGQEEGVRPGGASPPDARSSGALPAEPLALGDLPLALPAATGWQPRIPWWWAFLPLRLGRAHVAAAMASDLAGGLQAQRGSLLRAIEVSAERALDAAASRAEQEGRRMEARLLALAGGAGGAAPAAAGSGPDPEADRAALAGIREGLAAFARTLADSLYDAAEQPPLRGPEGSQAPGAAGAAGAAASAPLPAPTDPEPDLPGGADILGALRTRGCPVCDRMSQALFDYMRRLQYDLAVDERLQAAFAAEGGLCPLHTWQLEAIASPHGLSLGYHRLAARAAQELAVGAGGDPRAQFGAAPAAGRAGSGSGAGAGSGAGTGSGAGAGSAAGAGSGAGTGSGAGAGSAAGAGSGAGTGSGAGAAVPGPARAAAERGPTCRACRALRRVEEAFLRDLAAAVSDAAGRRAYAQAQGCCLRHLARLRERTDPETSRFLASEAARRLADAAEDMQGYALKFEAVRRGLQSGDEADAYLRALIRLAGDRSLCLPWSEDAEI